MNSFRIGYRLASQIVVVVAVVIPEAAAAAVPSLSNTFASSLGETIIADGSVVVVEVIMYRVCFSVKVVRIIGPLGWQAMRLPSSAFLVVN